MCNIAPKIEVGVAIKIAVIKESTGKRGRPSIPEHLRKNKPYVATGLPRGRRKKQNSFVKISLIHSRIR